ncbi:MULTISPECIES: DUF5994 family protein [unclassified Saccharothrix]|uniref:DUF5994 family protein n=1 Tax=unclassified Saccharothrix TaxID=2593673 RepID=UPI00307D42D2
MVSAPHLPPTPPRTERHPRRPRLEAFLPTGHLDRDWWPRSVDLVAGLPASLAVLAARLGDALRVNYILSEWNPTPRRGRPEGSTAHTLDRVAADGHRRTLLAVPSTTDRATAHRATALAAERATAQPAADLGAGTSTPHPADLSALAGWETDGGRVPQQTTRSTS